MDGYRGRDYYTVAEYKSATNIHFWSGVAAGMVGLSGFTVAMMWVFNYY